MLNHIRKLSTLFVGTHHIWMCTNDAV